MKLTFTSRRTNKHATQNETRVYSNVPFVSHSDTPMYDTVKIMLPSFEIFEPAFEKRINTMLTNAETVYNQETKQTEVRGNYKNLRIVITERGIWIMGSMAKYFYGATTENFLLFDDTEPSFQQLAYELDLPLNNAVVKRVDFGQNIQTETKSSLYLKTLLGMPRMERREQSNTSLLFTNTRRAFSVYGKTEEMKKRKVEIKPKTMRLESRAKKRVNEIFNVDKLIVPDLFKSAFQKQLITTWRNEYLSIDKSTIMLPDFTFGTPNELKDLLAAYAVQQIGLPTIQDSISTNKEQGNISRNTESRSKQMLKGLLSQGKTNPLVEELNKKVEQSYQELLSKQ